MVYQKLIRWVERCNAEAFLPSATACHPTRILWMLVRLISTNGRSQRLRIM